MNHYLITVETKRPLNDPDSQEHIKTDNYTYLVQGESLGQAYSLSMYWEVYCFNRGGCSINSVWETYPSEEGTYAYSVTCGEIICSVIGDKPVDNEDIKILKKYHQTITHKNNVEGLNSCGDYLTKMSQYDNKVTLM